MPRIRRIGRASQGKRISSVVGVNLNGLEFGGPPFPGTNGADYTPPTANEAVYFGQKGFRHVRLPFRWERLQPTLNGALDTAYLGLIQTFVAQAATNGVGVILCAFQTSSDYTAPGQTTHHEMGTAGGPTAANFGNLWSRIASDFVNNPAVVGYDPCNEPDVLGMDWGSGTGFAQTAINAIRLVDTITPIILEGSAGPWTANNSNLYTVTDPSNNMYFSAHVYFDSDFSGNYANPYPDGATSAIGVSRIQNFTDWAALHSITKLYIGEMGWPGADSNWQTVGDNALAFCHDNNIPVAVWAAGPFWGGYALTVEPSGSPGSYVDRPQIALMSAHNKVL